MKQERNKPYYAFSHDEGSVFKIPLGSQVSAVFKKASGDYTGGFNIESVDDNYVLVPISKVRTLYDGRYCAVAGFVFAIVNGRYSVLANRRGEGTPDFQGYWNCPCGFLERNETSQQGIAREIYEECSFQVVAAKLKVVGVQTEPEKCNNGNVTIHHTAFIGKVSSDLVNRRNDLRLGGEENEVSDVRWIPVDEIDMYRWAFGHEETIRKYMAPRWKRWFLEHICCF